MRKFLDRSFNHVNAILALNNQALLRLEQAVNLMAKTQADLDQTLQRLEDATTNLGTDLKDVFAFIKANPTVDLTAQVARGEAIADTLIQADADALAQENPLPVPPTP